MRALLHPRAPLAFSHSVTGASLRARVTAPPALPSALLPRSFPPAATALHPSAVWEPSGSPRVPVSQLRGSFRLAASTEPSSSSSSQGSKAYAKMAETVVDHTTQSNWQEARVTHYSFDIEVDFEAKVLRGVARITAEALADGVDAVALDTKELSIKGCATAEGAPAEYELGGAHDVLGSKLSVKLPAPLAKGGTATVAVTFETAADPMAAKFLDPEQTADKAAPYVFTQCQAIHARSLVPCQDAPGAKATYDARVTVPDGITALMSAVSTDAGADAGNGKRVFGFEQRVPIPSYLLALVAGKLESRELGERSRVWSEPSMVEACAYEFAETSKFLEAGEALCGDYVWGRYDLLVLPPSFPYGGMENPCLTFVTPTLLARDRSLTNVVAHEIAHSWSGNLVTNGSWEHFWLNEGWTVFIERKILGMLHGEPALQFAAASGYQHMLGAIEHYGAEHNFTALVPDLSDGKDPDDAFSRIPYEKGFYFLYYLQTCAGGAAEFEPFMKEYFSAFANKTVTSDAFKAFYIDRFGDKPAVQAIDWDKWLYAPGEPPEKNEYDVSLGAAAHALAKKWHASDITGLGSNGPEGASPEDIKGWSSDQVIAFLSKLLEYRCLTPLHATTVRKMHELYDLDASHNSEIMCLWYQLGIAAEDAPALGLAAAFVKAQGRMKFLRPIYRALFKSKSGAALAVDTFKEARSTYHPIAAKMVAVDLRLE